MDRPLRIGLGAGLTLLMSACVPQGGGGSSKCDADNPSAGTCADLDAQISTTLSDGKKANVLTGVGWGITGLGVALAVTGGVLFAKGKRKTDVWKAEQAQIRVLPTLGGLTIVGRF